MFVDAGRRHTPQPAYVRFAMLGLFAMGMVMALLGAGLQLWSLQLSLDARTAGNIFPALAAGLLAAFFLSREPAKSVGPGTRVLFVASGVLAATALAAMSFVYAAAWLPGPMFVLGTALGCFAGAAAALLERILTPRRARGVLDLAAVSFCLGGLAGCLSIRAAAGFVSPAGILRALAVLPLLAAVAASRAWRLRLPLPSVVREPDGRPRTFSLNFFLVSCSLLLQSAAYGIAACWLTVYLSRALGLTTRGGMTVLVVFWTALAAGRTAAARLPALRDSVASLAGPTAASCLGCVFLLQTARASGAAVGAALLGLGLGSLHLLTLRAMERRCTAGHESRLRELLFLSLAAALLACWPVGRFESALGIELAVWAPLGCSLAAAAALLVFVIEQRVSGESALA